MTRLEFYLKLIRFKDWFYHLAICMLAFMELFESLSVIGIFVSLGYSSIYLAWGYLFNNFFDKHEDSSEKNLFRNNYSSQQQKLILICMTLILCILSYYVGVLFVFMFVVLVNYLYSAPPVRLKNNALTSVISNAIFFSFVYYSTARIFDSSFPVNQMLYLPFVGLMFIPLQYIHYLEHREINEVIKLQNKILSLTLYIPLITYACFKLTTIVFILLCIFSICSFGTILYFPASKSRKVSRNLSLILGIAIFLDWINKNVSLI